MDAGSGLGPGCDVQDTYVGKPSDSDAPWAAVISAGLGTTSMESNQTGVDGELSQVQSIN